MVLGLYNTAFHHLQSSALKGSDHLLTPSPNRLSRSSGASGVTTFNPTISYLIAAKQRGYSTFFLACSASFTSCIFVSEAGFENERTMGTFGFDALFLLLEEEGRSVIDTIFDASSLEDDEVFGEVSAQYATGTGLVGDEDGVRA